MQGHPPRQRWSLCLTKGSILQGRTVGLKPGRMIWRKGFFPCSTVYPPSHHHWWIKKKQQAVLVAGAARTMMNWGATPKFNSSSKSSFPNSFWKAAEVWDYNNFSSPRWAAQEIDRETVLQTSQKKENNVRNPIHPQPTPIQPHSQKHHSIKSSKFYSQMFFLPPKVTKT